MIPRTQRKDRLLKLTVGAIRHKGKRLAKQYDCQRLSDYPADLFENLPKTKDLVAEAVSTYALQVSYLECNSETRSRREQSRRATGSQFNFSSGVEGAETRGSAFGTFHSH